MDSSEHYPDPFGEALSYSSQRAAQIGSLVAAGVEVAARRRALSHTRRAARGEQEFQALRDQQRAAQQQAKAGWAPAHDQRWLAQADLHQAARTWGAAVPYADADPAAATAMRKSEERLRTLHPYAMARYDRLRGEGASPLDAMGEAAPLFAREPNARPGPAGTRLQLGAGPASPDAGPTAGITDGTLRQPAPDQDPYQEDEQRGWQIIRRLQARALAERGSELSPDELATALEAATSLPAEVIARLARADSEGRVAAAAERARAADLDHASAAYPARERRDNLKAAYRDTVIADTATAHASTGRNAAQLAAEGFPCTAADGIRAAVTGGLHQPTPSPVRTADAQETKRPGLSL